MPMHERGEPEQASWNTGQGTTDRITYLLNCCAETGRYWQLTDWFNTLCSLFRELDCYMKPAERQEIAVFLNAAHQLGQQFLVLPADMQDGKICMPQYEKLDAAERALRRVAHTNGLLIPKKGMVDGVSEVARRYKLGKKISLPHD